MVPGLERLERNGPRVIYRLSRRCTSPLLPPLIGWRPAKPSTNRDTSSVPARFTIRDEHRARHQLPSLSLSVSVCFLLLSPFYCALIGREIGQGSGEPISSAEEMDDGSNTFTHVTRLLDKVASTLFPFISFSNSFSLPPNLIGLVIITIRTEWNRSFDGSVNQFN